MGFHGIYDGIPSGKPTEIVDLPIDSMVDLSTVMLVYQMVFMHTFRPLEFQSKILPVDFPCVSLENRGSKAQKGRKTLQLVRPPVVMLVG